MVVCSSRSRAVTSAFIWRCRAGSSGKGYLLALNASQICAAGEPRHFMTCHLLVAAIVRLCLLVNQQQAE